MTTGIDSSGLAKRSSGDLLRDLTNERQRILRRVKRAKMQLMGLRALKDVLRPYLQPTDYERIEERLQRELKRRKEEERDLYARYRDENHPWSKEHREVLDLVLRRSQKTQRSL